MDAITGSQPVRGNLAPGFYQLKVSKEKRLKCAYLGASLIAMLGCVVT